VPAADLEIDLAQRAEHYPACRPAVTRIAQIERGGARQPRRLSRVLRWAVSKAVVDEMMLGLARRRGHSQHAVALGGIAPEIDGRSEITGRLIHEERAIKSARGQNEGPLPR
jgi:hypothetical protein